MSKKTKIIKIDARNSIIEGNMVEIPFLYYGKQEKNENLRTVVEYKWKDASGKEYSVDISGSLKYGLPTPYELDVLLALLRIRAKQSNIEHGKKILSLEDVTNEHTQIEFTLNDICKELGKSNCGTNLKRIRQSLYTLASTKISSQSLEVVYDPIQKKHITLEEGAIYNIIDIFKWQTKKGGDTLYSDKNIVRIGSFFYYSIANSYFKYFDYELYLKLGRSGVAKRMFLLLTKWRNTKNTQSFKLETLYERIPLDKDYKPSKKREIVLTASKALKKAGFIEDYKMEKTKVVFIFAKEDVVDNKVLEKYNLATQLFDRLKDYGFTQEEIMLEHINAIMSRPDYMKALVRYTDDRIKKSDLSEYKGYLIKGIHGSYEIPDKYYNTNAKTLLSKTL